VLLKVVYVLTCPIPGLVVVLPRGDRATVAKVLGSDVMATDRDRRTVWPDRQSRQRPQAIRITSHRAVLPPPARASDQSSSSTDLIENPSSTDSLTSTTSLPARPALLRKDAGPVRIVFPSPTRCVA
jgi:hypothetical protein